MAGAPADPCEGKGCSIELIARTYGHLRHEDHYRALMRLFDEE